MCQLCVHHVSVVCLPCVGSVSIIDPNDRPLPFIYLHQNSITLFLVTLDPATISMSHPIILSLLGFIYTDRPLGHEGEEEWK